MEKILKNKKVMISLGCVLILVIVLGVGVFFFSNKDENKPGENNNPITDHDFTQDVTPEEAEGMYKDLVQDCTGALVFDLSVGDVVTLDGVPSSDSCKTDNHYSKLFGYTYDEDGNMIMHVKVLKREGDELYTLDGTSVGIYEEDKLTSLLDYGTTYVYTYQKIGDSYQLSKVEYARPVTNEVDDSNDEGNEPQDSGTE